MMDNVRQTTIENALKAGENETVLTLLEGIDVKAAIYSNKKTLLHLAAAYGNVFITDYLINCKCTIDAKDEDEITPLLVAVYFQHAEVMRILIDAGADLGSEDSNGRSPIFYVKLGDNPEIKEIMRLAIVNERIKRQTVIKHYMGDLYRSQNFEYQRGELSLNMAIVVGDFHQIQMNLKYGVSPNVRDECGSTPLHLIAMLHSCRSQIPKIMQVLFKYGADINAENNDGLTPLHKAAYDCNVRAITWLLSRGANVNATDQFGRTPLHAAIRYNTGSRDYAVQETIGLLLRNGTDIYAISLGGETILELSANLKDDSTSKFILKELAISEVQGKSLDEHHLRVLRQNANMRIYYERCKLELLFAKDCKIFEETTLLDLLTNNIQTLAVYTNNKDFCKTFKSLKLNDDFPIFSRRFWSKFVKAVNLMNRINMINQAAETLNETLPFFDDLIVRKLLQYLTINDIRLIAE